MLTVMLAPATESQAVYAQDATTGDWYVSRFDGENYLSETLEFNAGVGDWQEPLVADLDGDGVQSLFARDASTGDWWQFGNAQDTAAASRIGNWSLASTYGNYHVVDITGDGRDDIIGMSADGNWWALAFNGLWTGNVAIGYSGPVTAPDATYILDIDGDQRRDIVIHNTDSGYWQVLWHRNGGFRRDVIGHWNPANSYSHLFVADMNGDGAEEIVGQANYGGWWSLGKTAYGYGNTALAYWNPLADWRDITPADLNGDGRSEILGRDATTGNWYSISLHDNAALNVVIGNWDPRHTCSSVTAFDIDGDGLDELIGLASDGQWWMTEYRSDQWISAPIGNGVARESRVSRVADLDGNGTLDLASLDSENRLTILNAQGGQFSINSITVLPSEASPAAVLSIGNANTGRSAVMVWDDISGMWIRIEQRAGGLETFEPIRMANEVLDFSAAVSLDFDGDGANDLVRFDALTGRWFAAIFDGNQLRLKYLATWNSEAAWQQFLYGDIDGDGTTDIVARDETSGDWWAIRHVGTALVSARIGNWNTDFAYESLAMADLDGDGQREIIGLASYGGWWALDFTINHFVNVPLAYWGSGEWRAMPPVDMDGDGNDELVGFDPHSARWLIADSDTGASFTRQLATWDPAETYRDLHTIDFDGDGMREVVGRADGTGQWRRAYLLGSQAVDEAIAAWNATADWQNLSVGNFDGDAGEELIGQDSSDGTWHWLRYHMGQFRSETLGCTGPLERVWIANLDDDGYDELNYVNTADGLAYSANIEQGTLVPRVAATWAAGLASDEIHFGKAPGFSDATLKAALLNGIVGLREALATDSLAAAKLLLQWASNAANYALSQAVMVPSEQRIAVVTAAEAYYQEFRGFESACYCSGFATFYVRVLHLFDIPGFRYDFGTADLGITHSTVIVPTWRDGQWQYYLLDPTFNATFHDNSSGNDLDLLSMLDTVRAGLPLEAHWQTGDLSGRNWISDSPISNSSYQLRQSDGDRFIYGNPDYSLQTYLTSFTTDFLQYGLQPNLTGFVQLLGTYVVLAPTQPYPDPIANLIGELQQRGIAMN